MAQTFHTFRAETYDQAYSAMRRELGEDAIVIRTATVTEGGLIGALLGKKVVELTASSSQEERRGPGRAPQRYLDGGGGRSGTNVSRAGTGADTDVGSDARVHETVSYFKQVVEDAQRRAGIEDDRCADARADRKREAGAAETGANTEETGENSTVIRRELSEMREMLSVMSAELPASNLPAEFLPYYRILLSRGVDRKHAARLINAAAAVGEDRASREPRVFLERLKIDVRKGVVAGGGIGIVPGECRVVAVVGPTGVGKTTNLAKLAALYAVQQRARVGVITADTYRVAATDQLEVYTQIIDVDMRIVNTRAEMAEAVAAFRDRDLVLVDTAGGSPYNAEQLEDTREILSGTSLSEVHLLLSACTSVEDLRAVVERFSVLHPTALLFTKLDETKRYGPLYSLAAEAGLPLSYFSIGQNVPDDLTLADAGLVANLVVEGGEKRGRSGAKSA